MTADISPDKISLGQSLITSLDQYFQDLEYSKPHAIYELVLSAVEKPLLEYIMQKVKHNQTEAAKLLGINRNTLRKKLKQYHLE